MTLTPSSRNFEFIHLGGMRLNDNAFMTIKSSEMRKGRETSGEVRHGLRTLASISQFVIRYYFSCKRMGANLYEFALRSISFFRSHNAMIYRVYTAALISSKDMLLSAF